MGAYHELCRRNEHAPEHDLDDIDEGAQGDTASSEDGGDLKPSILEKHTVRMDDGNVDDWDSVFGDSAADALPTKPFAERTVADLSRVLCRSLSYHTPIPQALGTRAASLPHKTSCLTSTMSYLAPVAQHLHNLFKSGVSGTMDLGTEYGIPDVAQAGWWTHFSPMCSRPQFNLMMMQTMLILIRANRKSAIICLSLCCRWLLSYTSLTIALSNYTLGLQSGWSLRRSSAMLQIRSPRTALDRPLCTVVFEMVASIITWCILTDLLSVWLNTGGNL